MNPLPSNRGLSAPCAAGCEEIMKHTHNLQCFVINLKEEIFTLKVMNRDIYEIRKPLNQRNEKI